jgi:hypothetical protein
METFSSASVIRASKPRDCRDSGFPWSSGDRNERSIARKTRARYFHRRGIEDTGSLTVSRASAAPRGLCSLQTWHVCIRTHRYSSDRPPKLFTFSSSQQESSALPRFFGKIRDPFPRSRLPRSRARARAYACMHRHEGGLSCRLYLKSMG